MTFIFPVILYMVFIFPFSVDAYKIDGSKWLAYKILNSVISLYILIILAGSFKRLFHGITDTSLLIITNVPVIISILFSVAYAVISFFTSVQAIKLAFRKSNARVALLRIIPFMWMFQEIDKYFAHYTMYEDKPDLLFLVISGIFLALPWIGIFIFYSLEKTQKFLNTENLLQTK
jgi:hypothetical protein